MELTNKCYEARLLRTGGASHLKGTARFRAVVYPRMTEYMPSAGPTTE